VIAYTSTAGGKQKITVPDLTGLSMSAAFEKLNGVNLCMAFDGKGNAASQDPKPGTQVDMGTIITVNFRTLYAGAE